MGQPVMVAEIDEQHAAVIAHTMDPAGQADCLVDMAAAKRAAGVGAVAMHVDPEGLETRENPSAFGRCGLAEQARRGNRSADTRAVIRCKNPP